MCGLPICVEEAIEWADVLNVLRLQLERMQAGYIPSLREYYRVFGVTQERLAHAPRELLILHPGPMNRGVEIDSRVADGPHSVILNQVTNGVAVRMAVLYLLAGGRPELAEAADGGVAGAGKNQGAPDGAEVIDATGCVVAPGFVDLHVHLREPGREDVETIQSGARAAVAGGFTSVCAMPNTDPVTDNQAAVGFILAQARRAGTARVYPIGAVSLGQKGEQLTEFGELMAAGAVAVSDDGRPVATAHLMRTALEYALSFGIPVIDHCEECSLSSGGAMHEGLTATRLGIKGIPRAAEDVIVAHPSPAGAARMVRDAKARGVRVTAEVTPHHLALTDAACEGYNTHAKMNPPLREGHDVAALREALADGTIDCIATDHAPHHYDAKEAAFDDAPFGVVGLETAS